MSTDQDLWSARLPNGEVRSGTLEQLNEASLAGHLGEDTLVRSAHSDQWVKLADVQIWQVKLASGEVRSGTRQQLMDAFSAGHLDAEMPVLPAGAREWVRLGSVIGRNVSAPPGVAPSASPPAVARPVASAPPPSVAPAAYAAPPPSAAPVAYAAPPPSAAPVAYAAPLPSAAPAAYAAPPPSAAPSPPAQGEGALWQVRLADGQVRSGTREQLEEAFRAGSLGEGTFVLAPGAGEWASLGSMAGARPAAPAEASAPAAEPAPVAPEPAVAEVPSPSAESQASASEPVPEASAQEASPASAAQPEPEQPAVKPEPRQPAVHAAEAGDVVWQVKLTTEQLEMAIRAGLLGNDTLVLAAGSNTWVQFGDVRRTPTSPDASATNGASDDAGASAAG